MGEIKLFIYGAGGHGRVIGDIALRNGYEIEFIDDGNNNFLTFKDFSKKYKKSKIVIGIGDNNIRKEKIEICEKLGYELVNIIDKSVIVGSNVKIGQGTVIMPHCVINNSASIGKGVIINTGAIVEHDCIVEDFVHISPNAALAGGVKVGKSTHIGIGSSVIEQIEIGDNVIVGAGSVVIKNIEEYKKVVGIPAKELKCQQ